MKNLVLLLFLVVGLAIGVFLIQRQTNLKSKASSSFVSAFTITDGSGNVINCTSDNPPVCTTSTLNVNVKVKDLAPLTQ